VPLTATLSSPLFSLLLISFAIFADKRCDCLQSKYLRILHGIKYFYLNLNISFAIDINVSNIDILLKTQQDASKDLRPQRRSIAAPKAYPASREREHRMTFTRKSAGRVLVMADGRHIVIAAKLEGGAYGELVKERQSDGTYSDQMMTIRNGSDWSLIEFSGSRLP
jgi:hypothetical protein